MRMWTSPEAMPSSASRRFAGLRGAGEDGHPHAEPLDHAADGGRVLAGQNLGGGHHAGLVAVVDGQQHRHERHERLAAPHVALQQAVHLESGGRVLADFADDALLGAGEREGELLAVEAVEGLAHAREEEAVVAGEPLAAARQDVELHAQQLLELEAVLRLAQQLGRLREVDVVVGFAQRDEAVARAQSLGQRLLDVVGGALPRAAHDAVEPLGPHGALQPLGGGVDALHAALGLAREGLLHRLEFGVNHRKFVVVEAGAAEYEVFAPHLDALLDPLDAGEPDQLGRPRGVRDRDREAALAPLSGVADARHAGAELHERGAPFGDFTDAVDARAVDVAEGEVVEHVAQRADAELLVEQPRARLPHAGDEFYVVVQIVHSANIMHAPCKSKTGTPPCAERLRVWGVPAVGTAGVSGGDDGPTVFVWERSGCRFGRQLRLGSSLGRLSVRRDVRRGGRLPGRVCFGAARPAHSKKRPAVWPALVGKGFGCRFRVWRSVPCLALVGSGRRFGGVRPGACVRLPGRGYCSSSVIETLTCSLTKSPASSDAASRGTNSSSVKPIRYSRALYEPFWGPSMSVKFSVRLSF